MDIAGARRKGARIAAGLLRSRRVAGMRELAERLGDAVRSRPRPPADAHELCRALCEEMSVLRGGRPVDLRFERFPDEIEVTGLWVEFQDFDLVIVEERAEAVQQLVILGHELWHLHMGHAHRHPSTANAFAQEPGWNSSAGQPGWDSSAALAVAARNGSREADEADDFGHRLAAALRPALPGRGGGAPPDPVQRSLGYRGREGRDRGREGRTRGREGREGQAR
jgi:hypothetical protein